MAQDVHTVSVSDASDPLANGDRLGVTLKKGVAYGAGGSAGAAVTVPIAINLPASYAVFLGALPADATGFLTKTATGVTLSVQPRLASATLAAGAVDLLILY